MAGSGGSEGYGAPGPDGWGPSSAVGPAVGAPSYQDETVPALDGYGVGASQPALDGYGGAASQQALDGYGTGSVQDVDIASLGPRGNFASGSSSVAAVAAGDEYGAPAADPIGSNSDISASDEYGAPAAPVLSGSQSAADPVSAGDEYGAPVAPVLTGSQSAADPVSAGDEYGAPAAPVIQDFAASSPAVSASDEYGAPEAPVLQNTAASAPVQSASDSYGSPTADILPAPSQNNIVSADSGYGAPSGEPIIQDNSFAPSAVVESTAPVGDSYGSPRDPAPSSYDAPAVPSASYNRRNWSHLLV